MGTQENVETGQKSQGSFLDEIFVKVRDQLKDLSNVEVITATGDLNLKINPDKEHVLDAVTSLKILARTTIELDGDIVMILPTTNVSGEFKVNKEIMDIHDQNVDTAVQNWKNFMDTILNAVSLIAKLAGLGDVDIRDKLGLTSIVPPAKKS